MLRMQSRDSGDRGAYLRGMPDTSKTAPIPPAEPREVIDFFGVPCILARNSHTGSLTRIGNAVDRPPPIRKRHTKNWWKKDQPSSGQIPMFSP